MGEQTNNDQDLPDPSKSNSNASAKESLLVFFTSNPFYEQRAEQNKRSFIFSTKVLWIGIALLLVLFIILAIIIITNLHEVAILMVAISVALIVAIAVIAVAFSWQHVTNSALNQAMDIPNELQQPLWSTFFLTLIAIICRRNPTAVIQELVPKGNVAEDSKIYTDISTKDTKKLSPQDK